MRIAIDTRDLQIAKTGAQTYLSELCAAFAAMDSDHDFIHVQPGWRVRTGKSKFSKIANHLLFFWWKEFELPFRAWRSRCDLIFCTDYTAPLLQARKSIPVFYDASFWANPTHYSRLWRFVMNMTALPAARRAPAVITISQFAKSQIAQYTPIPPDRIVPVYLGPKGVVHQQLDDESIQRLLTRYGLEQCRPYGLFVGVLEKRKNLPRLIHAFARFLEETGQEQHLFLVGQPAPKRDMDDSPAVRSAIRELGLEKTVHLVGYVPDQDLPGFYQGSRYFAFPSTREGFGIPILEAYNSGTPVIAANATAIPEVAGDAALLFDPLDIKDMADAIAQVSLDHQLRKELIEKGRRQAACFDWNTAALEIIEVFERVLRRETPQDDTQMD